MQVVNLPCLNLVGDNQVCFIPFVHHFIISMHPHFLLCAPCGNCCECGIVFVCGDVHVCKGHWCMCASVLNLPLLFSKTCKTLLLPNYGNMGFHLLFNSFKIVLIFQLIILSR